MAATVDSQRDDSAAALPVAIHIKTPTRTFNLFFYFALDGAGRIWFKSIAGASPATDSVAPDWRVFGTGLPNDEAKKDFVVPRRIVSINADLDEVMAVSDHHRLYSLRWFENPVFKEDIPAGTWGDVHGWPVQGPLIFDLERDYFHASLGSSMVVGGLGNPLRTPVRVQIDAMERSPATERVIDAIFSTPALAASQDAAAELTVEGTSYSIVGAGFTWSWQRAST